MNDIENSREFSQDPKALRLARKLADTDFSVESGIRASLRARLLRETRASASRPPLFRLALGLSLAALALALRGPLQSVFTARPASPLLAHRSSARPRTAPLVAARPRLKLPVLPGRIEARRGKRPETVFQLSSASGLIVTRPIERLFDVARGRIVSSENGQATLWEFRDVTYILKTEKISLSELFQIRTL